METKIRPTYVLLAARPRRSINLRMADGTKRLLSTSGSDCTDGCCVTATDRRLVAGGQPARIA